MALRDIGADEVLQMLLRPYRFGESIDLQNYLVRGSLKITTKELAGIDFSGSVFTDDVNFNDSVFQGLSWFKNVEFRNAVNFHNVRFSSDARFDNANFSNGGEFSRNEFWGVCCFDGVVARRLVTMDHIISYGNLSLSHCDFQDTLSLKRAMLMGGLWMPGTNAEQLINQDTSTILGRIEK